MHFSILLLFLLSCHSGYKPKEILVDEKEETTRQEEKDIPAATAGLDEQGEQDGSKEKASSSCNQASPGSQTKEFDSKPYYVLIPESASVKPPYPVMFVMHGDLGQYESSAQNWQAAYDKNQDFMIVSVQSPNGISWWQPNKVANADWFDKFFDHILETYPVDLQRIYMAGWSGGSVFLSFYAMQRMDRIAGIHLAFGAQNYPVWDGYVKNCKMAVYFSQGSRDSLYPAANGQYQDFKKKGYDTHWQEFDADHYPSGGQKSEAIFSAWAWLSQKQLCIKPETAKTC